MCSATFAGRSPELSVRGRGHESADRAEGGLVGELFAIVAVILLALFLVPGYLDSRNRDQQRRTMSDLRTIGTAIESYMVDNAHAPMLSGDQIPIAVLRPALEPTYVRRLPLADEWGGDYLWSHHVGRYGYSIVSTGKDRRLDAQVYVGATTSFDSDLYFSDGSFTQYPEGRSY